MLSTRKDRESPVECQPSRDLTTLTKAVPLYVCSGLQGCGSTLVSWCFLQRSDMNGVLDGANDILPSLHPGPSVERLWYKSTISGFRLGEVVEHYRDMGWQTRPLLIVRDVRHIWASLLRKSYRHNGITAEDPPMRLRFRRFLDDWEAFRRQRWPMLRYEDFIASPEATLRSACAALELPWDAAMLHWPKLFRQIAHCAQGSPTFWRHHSADLATALAGYSQERAPGTIDEGDCDFLEREFSVFNEMNGYPPRLETIRAIQPAFAGSCPSFEQSRRFAWERKRNPWRRLLYWFGLSQERQHYRLSIK